MPMVADESGEEAEGEGDDEDEEVGEDEGFPGHEWGIGDFFFWPRRAWSIAGRDLVMRALR